MPVREVLRRHTSPELAEWKAYERAYGPISSAWRDETLAQVHELLQNLVHLTGAKFEENPMPKPRMHHRPGLLLQPQEVDE